MRRSELLNDSPLPPHPIIALTRNRRIFRLALTIAVALGSAGTSMSQSSNSSTAHTGKTLHVVSTVMFLVLTILQALQTLHLARSELSGRLSRFKSLLAAHLYPSQNHPSIGKTTNHLG